jgi:hypothetical protein
LLLRQRRHDELGWLSSPFGSHVDDKNDDKDENENREWFSNFPFVVELTWREANGIHFPRLSIEHKFLSVN